MVVRRLCEATQPRAEHPHEPGTVPDAAEAEGIIQAVDLRTEPIPPSVSQQHLDELCREILQIADLVLCGAESADKEIRAFNARTGHNYMPLHFAEHDSSRDLAEFAMEAARPARPRITDITTDELAEIVRRLLTSDPDSDYYLQLLQANVPHPRAGDLIFHPPTELRDAPAEQIVNATLTYPSIAL